MAKNELKVDAQLVREDLQNNPLKLVHNFGPSRAAHEVAKSLDIFALDHSYNHELSPQNPNRNPNKPITNPEWATNHNLSKGNDFEM